MESHYRVNVPLYLTEEVIKYLGGHISLDDYLNYFFGLTPKEQQSVLLMLENQLELGYAVLVEPQLNIVEEEALGTLTESYRGEVEREVRTNMAILQLTTDFFTEITLASLDTKNEFNATKYFTLADVREEINIPLLNVYTEGD